MCVISKHYITYRYNIICEVNRDGMILKDVSDEFKNDIYIVLQAIKQNIKALQYASDDLKNYKKFILNAIRTNGLVLEFVIDKFKNDRDIVSAAVEQNGHALQYASDDLQHDVEINLLAVPKLPKKRKLS